MLRPYQITQQQQQYYEHVPIRHNNQMIAMNNYTQMNLDNQQQGINYRGVTSELGMNKH